MTLGDQFYRVAPATPLEGGAFAVPDVVIDLAAREKARSTTDLEDATARLMGHDRETGRRPVGVSPYSAGALTEQEKREKAHQDFIVRTLLEQQLQAMLDDLYEERERLYVRLTEIQEERQRLAEQIEDHDAAIDRLDAIGTRIARDGLPARLRDGRFDDIEIEAVLRAYENRTGNTVDRSDLSDVQRVISIETRREKDGRADARNRVDDLDDQAHDVTDGIQDVEDRIDQVTRTLDRVGKTGFEEEAREQLGNRFALADAVDRGLGEVSQGDDEVDVPRRRDFGFGGGG